jgi:arsenate reductase (thioredoxin)
MNPVRVLFVCNHNSARSQMAEAFVNHLGQGHFVAESAGLEAGVLNPRAVEAMREVGIDISKSKTKSVFEMTKTGKAFDYVVAVCDEASVKQCPVFPGEGEKLYWGFPDPSAVSGSEQQKLQRTREIRDHIRKRVMAWLDEFS